MNHQDYVFSDVGSRFHLNVPKSRNIPAAFQDENEVGKSFPESEFPVPTYYPGVAIEENGNSQDVPTVPTNNPEPTCPVYTEGRGNDNNVVTYGNDIGQMQHPIGQQYCSDYVGPKALEAPFLSGVLPSGGTQFLQSVPQPQDCLDQFPQTSFPAPSALVNTVSLNHPLNSNAQEASVGNFVSATEYMGCGLNPQILYPLVGEAPILSTDSFTGSSASVLSQIQTSSFPPCSSSNFLPVVVPSIENQSQQNYAVTQNENSEGAPPPRVAEELSLHSEGNIIRDETLFSQQPCEEMGKANVHLVNENFNPAPFSVSEPTLKFPSDDSDVTAHHIDTNEGFADEKRSISPQGMNTGDEAMESTDIMPSCEPPIENDAGDCVGNMTPALDKKGDESEMMSQGCDDGWPAESTPEFAASGDVKQADQTREPPVCAETSDDFTTSLEKGIAGTSQSSIDEERLLNADAAENRIQEERLLSADAAENRIQEERLLNADAAENRIQEERLLNADAAESRIQEERLLNADAAENRIQEERLLNADAAESSIQEDRLLNAAAAESSIQEDRLLNADAAESRIQEERLLNADPQEGSIHEESLPNADPQESSIQGDRILNANPEEAEGNAESGKPADSDDPEGCANAEKAKPPSPMITVMDSTFGEGDELGKLDNATNSNHAIKVEREDGTKESSVRVTRSGTGSLRNRTRRFIEEFYGSDDSSTGTPEDWEYEEGAELAPSKVDSSVTVPQDVLTVTQAELEYYKRKFSHGVEAVLRMRLHCTACGRHIGAAPNYLNLGNRHKVLRVLLCHRCQAFYGVGSFTKDSDGSELYCRWCGQGGQVICCNSCPNVFCEPCIKRNFGPTRLSLITSADDWLCFLCNYRDLWELRSICWAALAFASERKKEALNTNDAQKMLDLEEDKSKCCSSKNHKKKRSQGKSKATGTVQETFTTEEDQSFANFEFGHFLFANESLSDAVQTEESTAAELQNTVEEDDFIDPSQFVQPVLEDLLPPRCSTRSVRETPARALQTNLRPQAIQVRVNAPQQIMFPPTASRVVIRQGNLIQPGLVPINKQPNRLLSSPITRPPLTAAKVQASHSSPLVRNPAHYLNNMDGVRSFEQMQNLNQVPWFRDGIDNVRASGFALTKRIRELEARFHSLKNKQDVEKVMILGKKLERLTERTMLRYRQLNLGLREACKSWYFKRSGIENPRAYRPDPFSLFTEAPSDWEDDVELSKPLEKVVIPVSSAVLQGGGIRPSAHPSMTPRNLPPLIRSGSPSVVSGRVLLRPQVAMQTSATGSAFAANSSVRTVYPNPNPMSYTRVQLPGPKSGAVRYKQVPNTSVSLPKRSSAAGVGAYLNERNGFNTISVSITHSAKRKRHDSESSDGSDIVICPTVPELLKKYNIKPCKVLVKKNDGFISSFLENQEQIRVLRAMNACDDQGIDDISVSMDIQEVETAMVSCNSSEKQVDSTLENIISHKDVSEGPADATDNRTDQRSAVMVEDDDDDIEIIDEVKPHDSNASTDTFTIESMEVA